MAKDLRQRLRDNARRRTELTQEEKELIAEAWRSKIPPTEIAHLIDRSLAHVRKLRPDDVPPLRMGGNAKKNQTPPTEADGA